jgi:hypothetical protein
MRKTLPFFFCLAVLITIFILPHSSLAEDRINHPAMTAATGSYVWPLQEEQSAITCPDHAVMVQGAPGYYTSIQSAYNASEPSVVINAQALTFYGDLLFDDEKTVQLIGGYNCDFSSNPDLTVVTNQITIKGGQAVIENIIIASPDLAQRTLAATSTAQSSSNACSIIQPFYWEIGNKTGLLAGGSVNKAGNSTTYTATTLMPIASASKWIYGSYVAQKRNGLLTDEDIWYLHFWSGYTNFSACESTDTIATCVARDSNGVQNPHTKDKFFYNGGHMQVHASLPAPGMNLGALDNSGLATEIRNTLGTDIWLIYTQPQPAGGVFTNAANYAILLRKMLNNQLYIAYLLGSSPVCTNPQTCPDALYTPINGGQNFYYSIGHWVEDDPDVGDGSFSSAGAFGFYPWIDKNKEWYGIISRLDLVGGGNGEASANCGALIRKAWISGVGQ